MNEAAFLILLFAFEAPATPPRPNREPPSERPARRIHPRALTLYGSIFGAGMIALAWLWAGILQGRDLGAWFPGARRNAGLAIGAAAGAAFALIVWRVADRVPALQRIERRLLTVLDMDALRYPHALLFGLIAGIPEEILFRGAMQPVAGLVVTAAVFGALHAITPVYFCYATGAGMLLGVLAIWNGGLWTPIAAHAVIDAVMFALLIRRWRHDADRRSIN
jgi:hypothetical protein